MTISDADFAAWLRTRDVARCYLVEAGYGYDSGGVQEAVEYASDIGYVSHATDTPALTCYPDILAAIPTIQFSADAMTVGEIEIDNSMGVRDEWLTRYWDGRAFTLLIGAPGWARADFRPVLSGTLAGLSASSQDRLVWRVRDNRVLLDKPCQPNKYPENADHPTAIDGRPKPLCLGYCYNVEPVWIPPDGTVTDIAVTLAHDGGTDTATATSASAHGRAIGDIIEINAASVEGYGGVYVVATVPTATTLTYDLVSGVELGAAAATLSAGSLTYQVHDGPIEAITAVRAGGEPIAYAANPAAGTLALSVQPYGPVRADVKGATLAGVFAETCSDLTRWLAGHAGLDPALLDDAALTDFATECPQELGLYITGERSLADALAELAATLGAYPVFGGTGKLRYWRLIGPQTLAAGILIGEDDIQPDTFYPAEHAEIVYRITPGYQRNWAPLDRTALEGRYLSDEERTWQTGEYRTSPMYNAYNAAILERTPLAQDLGQVDFLFSHPDPSVALSRARGEALRRVVLYGWTRYTYRLSVWAAPGLVEIGDQVTIAAPRFGFDAGLKAIVTGINERPSDGIIELEVWR